MLVRILGSLGLGGGVIRGRQNFDLVILFPLIFFIVLVAFLSIGLGLAPASISLVLSLSFGVVEIDNFFFLLGLAMATRLWVRV